MIPDQIRNTQSWGSAVPGKHPTLRYGCYVITGNPLGSWRPAPTIKISVWFEYSMIPDQNPEFAELGLCGPREASYAPLRMLCHYRQFAGKLKLQLRRWEVGAPAPIKKNGVVSG